MIVTLNSRNNRSPRGAAQEILALRYYCIKENFPPGPKDPRGETKSNCTLFIVNAFSNTF